MEIFKDITPAPVDVVIASVPWTSSTFPLLGVAILKSIAVEAGHSCAGLDLNANVVHWVRQHPERDKLIEFFHNETYYPEIEEALAYLYRSYAEIVLAHKPKIVALSLFTYVSQPSARYICYYLRLLDPTVTIVIGGTGAFENLRGISLYSDELKDSGLIDHYIRGDGERAFAEFLAGNYSYPGIDGSDWQVLTNEELDSFPYPNYDDYNFDLYTSKTITMLASRGCVRQCKFCDVIEYWDKFTWRTGQGVYEEMLYQNKKYGIQHFKFQDSLINGNMKEFKVLIRLLAEHNDQNPDNRFTWSSQFIFRPVKQFNEELWELTARSGADILLIGVESMSEHIRDHMGKHFSNDDILFSLQMARKYGIQFVWLMIVGYVTETEQDIEFAAQWFRDHVEYKDLIKIQFGGTLGILPGTYLDRHKEQLNIVTFGPPYQKWNNTVTGSTPEMRFGWQRYLVETCRELGYEQFEDLDNHLILEMMMKK